MTDRLLPQEIPVALSFNGTTEAVMMATPAELADFGAGFALTEGIVSSFQDITELTIVALEDGYDVQMQLAPAREAILKQRRRKASGPVGCGLCGIESIEAALRDLPQMGANSLGLSPKDISAAVTALSNNQPLRNRVGAVHGAGFWHGARGLIAVREDVGRHNALDKLVGALALDNIDLGEGALVISSRVSVDMVQKAVLAGAPMLIAVSTPTDLAVKTANAAGLTLVALARGDTFEVFSHPERVTGWLSKDLSARNTLRGENSNVA